jgi:hypothetical protein
VEVTFSEGTPKLYRILGVKSVMEVAVPVAMCLRYRFRQRHTKGNITAKYPTMEFRAPRGSLLVSARCGAISESIGIPPHL